MLKTMLSYRKTLSDNLVISHRTRKCLKFSFPFFMLSCTKKIREKRFVIVKRKENNNFLKKRKKKLIVCHFRVGFETTEKSSIEILSFSHISHAYKVFHKQKREGWRVSHEVFEWILWSMIKSFMYIMF